ncbi:uncharacterized protein F5Z01DRAFT_271949 [Emericellopsis atlantica]|uniref:Ribosomal protein S21 n=1 Tax=Emericellopsis atlantica TaxID=2614577 RepID=A0A9P7ZGX3_9HYPO|nr:uncharacterized protein F5Z01DRAFT_271949 [Emericellopsis atlantica]KAG9251602.1 hypothetical protein F5Z01DRAFT_271949 [Emericellopsis atlantica]
MSAPRISSMLLSRAPAPRAFTSTLTMRPLTTSSRLLAKDRPVRHNPLVGNYTPPKPQTATPTEEPLVSTENPQSSEPPASSAEVPPNADMPPPPPPPPSAEAATNAKPGESTKPAAPSPFAYDATRHVDIHKIVSEKMEPLVATTSADPLKQPRMRTAPVAGRTVFVDQSLGLPAALKALQRLVSLSKIKRLATQQKFHERPGMKRKRLRMLRWRKRFKDGFQATTRRVREMKKQGW